MTVLPHEYNHIKRTRTHKKRRKTRAARYRRYLRNLPVARIDLVMPWTVVEHHYDQHYTQYGRMMLRSARNNYRNRLKGHRR